MNLKTIVTFISLVMLISQFGYSQNVKSNDKDKTTQAIDTIISAKSAAYYDTPAQYSKTPVYPNHEELGFYSCVWDSIDFTDIEVILSAENVILNFMIDTEGDISAFKLINPTTKNEIKECDYSPFHKELIKGLADTEKWIPAHFEYTPIAFPLAFRFRIPRGFWESLE